MMEAIHEADIRAAEHGLGVELPYMREIARVAPELLGQLERIRGAAEYPRHVPTEVRHLAALGATMAQDCGPCVQIGVNLALADGVDPAVLRSALGLSGDSLEDEQADALAFGRAVGEQAMETDSLRRRLRERFGDAGVVSLSWAIAVAQFYPVLKRAMGFAQTCSAFGVTVEV